MHIFGIVSKGFAINDNLVFNPTIIYKGTKSVSNIDGNLNFLIKQRVWVGVFFRSEATAGALVQVFVNNNIRVGYSFDTGITRLQKRLGNGHEIMIGFDFNTFKAKMLN